MGLPEKVLADDETALLVLHPHVRRLVRPALVLLLLAPAAGYALGAVPAGPTQGTIRAVVGGRGRCRRAPLGDLAVRDLVDDALRAHRRAAPRAVGIVRRTGHDLPLRGITDVVVAQRLGERLLRSGTLSVTTEGGARFTMTDVPGVSRLQHGLLAVADDVAERLAAPARRFRRGQRDDRPGADEELGGRYLQIGPGPAPDAALGDGIDRRDRRRDRRRRRPRRRRRRAGA